MTFISSPHIPLYQELKPIPVTVLRAMASKSTYSLVQETSPIKQSVFDLAAVSMATLAVGST
jgi:hypothetical protein